ncbi:Aldo-ket-red domain-containing protein [Mycena venus]|uniref:Aldo-ket-red domain-containing protein n=1 Tax=Mycena venus TaxID=2733690 RepID=A0A8H6YQ05_9AGAR|nr:Aldo-ket-red domain-containing protein [Mycena venus]
MESAFHNLFKACVLDKERSHEVLKAAWDTANIYCNRESEKVIGTFLKKYNIPCHKITIATKVHGLVTDSIALYSFQHPELKEQHDYVNQDGLSRAGIFNTVDASLKCLGIDYINLLQIHRFDPNTPIGGNHTCTSRSRLERC